MKKLFIVFSVALFAVSCATSGNLVAYREYSVRNTEPTQSPIVVAPLLAELQVMTEQSVCETIIYDDFVVKSSNLNEIETYKKLALYTVANKYNADTMVGALINVDTTVYGRLSINVKGYPARYVKFRTMEEKDTWVTELGKGANEDRGQQPKAGGLLNMLK